MLRIGTVSEIDQVTARARVLFTEDGGLVSPWLAVLHPRTSGDVALWMPALGETVACLLQDHHEFGVVIGSMYDAVDLPPAAPNGAARVAFADGMSVQYDPAAHALAITLPHAGSALAINVTGDVTITVPDGHHVEIGGAAGQRLATEDWITERFDLHTHPTPVGMTGVPVDDGVPLGATRITERARGV